MPFRGGGCLPPSGGRGWPGSPASNPSSTRAPSSNGSARGICQGGFPRASLACGCPFPQGGLWATARGMQGPAEPFSLFHAGRTPPGADCSPPSQDPYGAHAPARLGPHSRGYSGLHLLASVYLPGRSCSRLISDTEHVNLRSRRTEGVPHGRLI